VPEEISDERGVEVKDIERGSELRERHLHDNVLVVQIRIKKQALE
jgi:hypothetical protein